MPPGIILCISDEHEKITVWKSRVRSVILLKLRDFIMLQLQTKDTGTPQTADLRRPARESKFSIILRKNFYETSMNFIKVLM